MCPTQADTFVPVDTPQGTSGQRSVCCYTDKRPFDIPKVALTGGGTNPTFSFPENEAPIVRLEGRGQRVGIITYGRIVLVT